MADTSVVKLIL